MEQDTDTPTPDSSESNNQTEEKFQYDMDALIRITYDKVAEWFNSDQSQPGLKFMSVELVEAIAGKIFNDFGIKYTVDLDMDAKTRETLEKSRTENKSLDELSETELVARLEKLRRETLRKKNQDTGY